MRSKKLNRTRGFAWTAVLLVAVATGVLSREQSGADATGAPRTTRETSAATEPAPPGGITSDVSWYAADNGISVDEAQRRLDERHAAGPVLDKIQTTLPGRFAGLWLENAPTLRAVAWFTGAMDGLDGITLLAAESPIPIEIRAGAPATITQLNSAQAKVMAMISSPGDVVATSVDVQSGAVVVDVSHSSSLAARATSLQSSLSAKLGVPVEIVLVDDAPQNASTYGGERLTYSSSYNDSNYWASGFSVANYAGATGVLTAGHCQNSPLTYWDPYPYPSAWATTFVSETFDAYHDAQWSSVDGTEYPYFYNGSSLSVVHWTVPRAAVYERLRVPLRNYDWCQLWVHRDHHVPAQ